MEQVESLKKQIDDEIRKTKGKTGKTIRNRLVVSALEGDKRRLERIESILKIEKYDLVFIGQQGVGKTTAICHLFGLTTDKIVEIKKGAKMIEKTVVQELLSTGSGKTTICEVAIVPDETTFIEVTPIDEKDLEQLIDDFCLHQWNKWQKNNPLPEQEGDQINEMIPTELMRAVQNMAGLKNSELDELLKQTEEQKNFHAEILKRSGISQRTETRIVPSPGEEEKSWIRGTFNSLNYCKLKNFSIPKRINIHVNQGLLNPELFSNINSIIDTKGIGAGELRKDIDRYFQSKNSFCLLVERFASAPANVIGLMKEHLTHESQDISSKVALFVMPRENEPEKTPGADGSRKDGIDCRKRNIDDELMVQKINFLQDNIIFHDPLEYYMPEGNGFRRDPDYEETEFQNLVISERKRILSEVQTLIGNRKQLLVAELKRLAQHLEEIKKGKGIDEQDEQLIADMRNKISGFKELPTRGRDTDDFIRVYVNEEFAKRNHMTVRAINSRYGRYDVRNRDIYYGAISEAKRLLKEIAQPYKDGIIETIKSGMEEASPDLQVLIQNLERQVDSGYDDLLREFSTKVSGYLENTVFHPQDRSNAFWQKVQQRWGKGPGYKADVVEMYRDQLID